MTNHDQNKKRLKDITFDPLDYDDDESVTRGMRRILIISFIASILIVSASIYGIYSVIDYFHHHK